jgi:6-phosphofructokinase 1
VRTLHAAARAQYQALAEGKECDMASASKLGILVGGGPAPGINSVIGAASIRSALEGVEVVGIKDGFDRIMRGAPDAAMPLTMEKVSRLHFRGGSFLGISRANPTKDPKHLAAARDALEKLGVTMLITIGGDDTAFSSMKLSEAAGGKIRVVHVPKTIDNDLDLPPHIDTFGFQTARHWGVELVKNLMVDAYTTSRWYIVVSMGRKAGHLALGIGKSVGATVTLISEEFGEGIPLKLLVDTLAMSVVKRQAMGRRDGVAVVAEGLVLSIDPKDLAGLEEVERDEHGHVRLAEVDIGEILKRQVSQRLASLGVKTTLVSKNIGYELRCADPIPYDMEYTRDLGYCAAKYLLSGGDKAMVSMQGGRFVPVPFHQLIDPRTGRARVRLVDVRSDRYAIARRYMIRLRRDDFEDAELLGRIAATIKLTPEELRRQFEYLVESEPPPLTFSP